MHDDADKSETGEVRRWKGAIVSFTPRHAHLHFWEKRLPAQPDGDGRAGDLWLMIAPGVMTGRFGTVG